MAIICYLAALFLGVHIAEGYKIGPPIHEYRNICETLYPLGHGAEEKTSPPPFRIDVSNTCANETIFVTISTTDNMTWFEGFFIQARPANGATIAYGEFGTNNDPQLQGLKCHNSPTPKLNNSLGHSQAKRYRNKKFTWTPPAFGVVGGLQFVATVVHETPDFWLNVKSAVISTTCMATALVPTVAGIVMTAAVILYNSVCDD